MSHLYALHAAFDALEAQGYQTIRGETCCGGCAFGFFQEKYGDQLQLDAEGHVARAVFYTEQSLEYTTQDGGMTDPMWLNWAGDAAAIVAAIQAQGLVATWDGTKDDAICVRPILFSTGTPRWRLAQQDDEDEWEEEYEEEYDDEDGEE